MAIPELSNYLLFNKYLHYLHNKNRGLQISSSHQNHTSFPRLVSMFCLHKSAQHSWNPQPTAKQTSTIAEETPIHTQIWVQSRDEFTMPTSQVAAPTHLMSAHEGSQLCPYRWKSYVVGRRSSCLPIHHVSLKVLFSSFMNYYAHTCILQEIQA